MKELGEYLKRTRISNGVSLTEACEDLEFSTSHLENIESGNVRAFKDIYDLKEDIKVYAKYLGLNSDKVIDEFNNFLFQHTSKISLEDIKAAVKKTEEEFEEKKVMSPYTIPYQEKKNMLPFVFLGVAIVLFILITYVVVSKSNKQPERTDELSSYREEIINYEFA